MPPTTSPLRVLIVDDDPAFAELITCVLELDGVDVVGHARDGVEGSESAVALRPDVVVMDVRMPRMDGLEAIDASSSVSRAPSSVQLVTTPKTSSVAIDSARPVICQDRATAELLHG